MAALDTFPGLSEALDDVKSLLATEEQDSSETDANLEDSTLALPEMGGVVLRIISGRERRPERQERA